MKRRIPVYVATLLVTTACVSQPAPWKPDGTLTDADAASRANDAAGEVVPGDGKVQVDALDSKGIDVAPDSQQPTDVVTQDSVDLVEVTTKDTVDADDVTEETACQPDCEGKECGDDGCGGSCGACEACGQECSEGSCVFVACEDKECGSDGCGGSCGTCDEGFQCGWGMCSCSFPTPPQSEWSFTMPSLGKTALYGAAVREDGYVVATGETPSNSIDTYVVAVDKDGELAWEKTFGDTGLDRGMDVQVVGEGVVVAGYSHVPQEGNIQGQLLFLDGAGNKQSSALFGGSGADEFLRLKKLPDGGFVAAGITSSDSYGDWDFWVVRTDPEGNEIWSNHYGSTGIDYPLMDVEMTEDGGYVLVGGTEPKDSGNRDIWLGRIDSQGTLLWEQTYGEELQDTGYGVEVLKDGGLAMAAASGTDSVLIRTDAEGGVLWQKTYGGEGTDTVRSLDYIPGSGFLLAGHTGSIGAGNWDMWLLRTDEAGNVLWETAFGTPASEKAMAGLVLPGGEFVLAGYVIDANDGDNWDVQVVKTASECCQPNCDGKQCGDDGCGGSCGGCGELESCTQTPAGTTCAAQDVLIPAGEFWMGCNTCPGSTVNDVCGSNEYSYHLVHLDNYGIDRTEVTAAQYEACFEAGVCTALDSNMSGCTWQQPDLGQNPANCIDRYQSTAYCNWVGKRLCTEAEWEKAARGGCEIYGEAALCKANSRKFPWGNAPPTCDHAVIAACGTETQPVCSKSPTGDSPYGLCDMAGNVWERVADIYQKDYYCVGPQAVGDTACESCGDWPGAPEAWSNPQGPESGESWVSKGGRFGNEEAAFFRVSNRDFGTGTGTSDGVGFRCCKSNP